MMLLLGFSEGFPEAIKLKRPTVSAIVKKIVLSGYHVAFLVQCYDELTLVKVARAVRKRSFKQILDKLMEEGKLTYIKFTRYREGVELPYSFLVLCRKEWEINQLYRINKVNAFLGSCRDQYFFYRFILTREFVEVFAFSEELMESRVRSTDSLHSKVDSIEDFIQAAFGSS